MLVLSYKAKSMLMLLNPVPCELQLLFLI